MMEGAEGGSHHVAWSRAGTGHGVDRGVTCHVSRVTVGGRYLLAIVQLVETTDGKTNRINHVMKSDGQTL
jgi:hypothetical protein